MFSFFAPYLIGGSICIAVVAAIVGVAFAKFLPGISRQITIIAAAFIGTPTGVFIFMLFWAGGELGGDFAQHYLGLLGQIPELIVFNSVACIVAAIAWTRSQSGTAEVSDPKDVFE